MLKHINPEILVKRCAVFRKIYARINAPESKHYQLPPSGVDILILLSNNYIISMAKELSALLDISKGSAARRVRSLLPKGCVYIETGNSNRHIQHLSLTEAAQEVTQTLLERRSEVEAHILKGTPQEYVSIVLQTFNYINVNIRSIIGINEYTLEKW